MCEILNTGLTQFNIPLAFQKELGHEREVEDSGSTNLTTLQANTRNLKSEIRMFLERWRMREKRYEEVCGIKYF